MYELKGSTPYGEWNIQTGSSNAQIGVNKDFAGIELKASIFSHGSEVEIPLPFTTSSLSVGAEYDIGSLGIELSYDPQRNKLKIGASAIVGGRIWVGID